jgi:methionyl-tRNA formyltransferase
VGCSVILLDEGIDSGLVLFSREYALNDGFLDYDITVDTIVRTETLLELFERANGNIASITPQKQIGEPNTFFIIHPVLKHLATLKASGASKEMVREV